MGLIERIFGRDSRSRPALTPKQRAHWEANGFLVLRGFMPEAELQRVEAVVEEEWTRKPNDHEVDVLTGPHAGRTFRMEQAPPDAKREVYKLNNLFARRPEIRAVALAPPLRAVLADLLEGEPMICNSLNFERGSQQHFHIDTWYMPPPVDDRMVVASIALDDVGPDNGPLVYYPGSNRIQPYRFSHGRLNIIEAEAGKCWEHLNAEIARLGLQEEEFRGKRGDVFLWHARLLHGGRPIRDMSQTRRTLVVHYWRAGDLPADEVRVDPVAGSYLGRTLRGEITVYRNPAYDPRVHHDRVQRFVNAGLDESLRLVYPLDHGSLVLDLGGFHGDFSMRINAKYGATCHCFEVVPELCEGIRARTGANAAIKVHAFGLAGTTRREELFLADEGSSTLADRGAGRRITIELVRASDWFRDEVGDRDVDLMKINIEGGEYELLEHMIAAGLVGRVRDIQVQFHEDVIPDASARMERIQRELAKTHRLTFQEKFVWENWRRRDLRGDA